MDVLKKLLALVLILVLALAVLAPAQASACQYNSKAAYATAVSIANQTNAAVKAMVLLAQLSWIDDAKATEFAANALIAAKKLEIKALGFDAVCTWDTYIVDGHTIKVDPLHVVNPLPPDAERGN